jgi:hypothetical protein
MPGGLPRRAQWSCLRGAAINIAQLRFLYGEASVDLEDERQFARNPGGRGGKHHRPRTPGDDALGKCSSDPRLCAQAPGRRDAAASGAAPCFHRGGRQNLFEIAKTFHHPSQHCHQLAALLDHIAGKHYLHLRGAGALAKRHVSYGAKAEHYPVVGAALLWTLEKGLGDGWTPEVADAWGTAYGTLSGYMISEAYGRSQAPRKISPERAAGDRR